jgi:succinate dehydrogenase flavin-adding protein (antitoxin of CptAB toxin-antitoxin module)
VGELDRIHWHCRRGLLELDLVLERFQKRVLPGLSAEEMEAFKRLLALSDNDLWDLVTGRLEPEPGLDADLVRTLREI